MSKLTVRSVAAKNEPGMYGDGGGLYLRVGPTGSKSWILRTMVHKKRRELGLGSVELVSLAEAREAAQAYRKVARSGGDPETLRKRESLTFAEAAKKVHAQLLPTWKNKKHADTWLASVENHTQAFAHNPLHTVTSADIMRALEPIWTKTPETARRLRQRLSTIFDWAKGKGLYPHENPVNGLKKALVNNRKAPKHMPAMEWRDLPDFMSELADRDGISARCLEFIILTTARSGDARGARWSEIDIKQAIWTIPGDRMKRDVEHRVPLCKQALAILEKVRGLDAEFVFPSVQRDKQGRAKEQSNMVFSALLKRMGKSGFTVHGFRSTFRDWASESARADREVAEAALSHATGNAAERAYARSDLFERRRELMDAWGRYALGQQGSVVQMVRA
ncbi:tyrosine-type recombinase/integrase [Yoonia litorea]|uniref:Integrase n=1 Tax=Yoonia litorea TaxID=1123755 RepID=A0A1I6L4N0_9RHOB|nr:integrase arm-type DNA-binding domain-containing protein [Yoonia litorea]SFR98394.1 Integrase [Yoonia litorea]